MSTWEWAFVEVFHYSIIPLFHFTHAKKIIKRQRIAISHKNPEAFDQSYVVIFLNRPMDGKIAAIRRQLSKMILSSQSVPSVERAAGRLFMTST